jgi:hypothetical protein
MAPERASAAPAAAIPAIGQALPAAYDPEASYEAQAICDPAPKPGTKALASLIRRTYGRGEVVSITRGCRVGGTSEHKEGRALDWMTSIRSKRGFANARAFLTWLLGPDHAGVPFGNATRLGVMYVGWNNRYWAAYAKDRGWAELKGCLTKGGDDTTCHRNHIHISLSWDGASGRTSMWDGTVLTSYCPSPWSVAPLAAAGRAATQIPVAPATVLNTRLGFGVSAGSYIPGWDAGSSGAFRDDPVEPSPSVEPAAADSTDVPSTDPPPPDPGLTDPSPALPTPVPSASETPPPLPAPAPSCRLHASGWHGDHPGVLTKVTGHGGVPDVGVAAVSVTVTALGSTAPASVSIWSPSEEAARVLNVRMNGRGHGSAVIPIAADGTIGFSTTAGATDLLVQVTGYYPLGDQPNLVLVG